MKVLQDLRKIVVYAINIFYIALLISTLIGIMSRVLPGINTVSWSMEISRYSMIWLVMMVSSVNIKDRDEIIVEVFMSKIKGKTQKIIAIFGDILILIFLIIMLIYGTKVSLNNWVQSSPSLGLPMTFAYLSMPIGALIMLIEKIIVTIEDIKSVAGKSAEVKTI